MQAAIVVALALAVALPAAEAAPVEGSLTAGGTTFLRASLDGAMLAEEVHYERHFDHGTGSATVQASGIHLQLYSNPYVVTHSPDSDTTSPDGQPVLLQDFPVGALRATTTQEHGTLRFLPLADGTDLQLPLHLAGNATIALGLPSRQEPRNGEVAPIYNGRTLASPGHRGSLQAPDATGGAFKADVVALFFGALVEPDTGAPIPTGDFYRPDLSFHDPTGQVANDYFDRFYVVAEARAATIQVASNGSAGWHWEVPFLAGHLRGEAAFEHVAADAALNHTLVRGTHGLLALAGGFGVSAAYGDGAGHWRVQGDATFAALDGHTLVGAPAAGALGLLGLLAAAALAPRVLPALLAGYHRAEPLANATRRRILQTIGERPGCTAMELARAVGCNRSSVTFHLAVLKRADLIDIERRGRFEHLLLNSRSYRFNVPAPRADDAAATVEAPTVFAALSQPTCRRVFEALLDGPSTYGEANARWAAAGTPPLKRTTFLHHATALEAEGILRRAPRGRQTEWQANLDFAGILHRQARVFLSANDRSPVLAAVRAHGPATLDDLRRALPGHAEVLAERLRELLAFGFLAQDEAGRYLPNRRGIFRFINDAGGPA